jgi:DNA-binding transcriptional LysR family regulator
VIDVKPLRYFVTLAETRHFGRAAARLNLSQPPLSRQLAALEANLGVTLIERSPRSVTLTAAGERFYADAKAILSAIEQAARNAQAAAHGDTGRWRSVLRCAPRTAWCPAMRELSVRHIRRWRSVCAR